MAVSSVFAADSLTLNIGDGRGADRDRQVTVDVKLVSAEEGCVMFCTFADNGECNDKRHSGLSTFLWQEASGVSCSVVAAMKSLMPASSASFGGTSTPKSLTTVASSIVGLEETE